MELLPVLELERGGMGTVSVAARVEGGFQRYYAVKRLLPELRADQRQRQMFLEEARIAGSLQHPNVVPVLDVGEDEDGPFLVMEYVDGVSLGALLKTLRRRGQLLSIAQVLLIARDIVHGLDAAHRATSPAGEALKIVHRDISPQNVLVDFQARARVTDFGIARATGRDHKTQTGILKGKLGYMSPEQLRFRPVDQRSDLFSFGVVLYEMAAGIRLYPPGEDGASGARAILDEPPPDLGHEREDAPSGLVRLVLDLLMKDPDARSQTAADVCVELDALLLDYDEAFEVESLRELLKGHFGMLRDERSRDIAEAVSVMLNAPSPAVEPVAKSEPPSPSGARWPTLVVGALVLAAAATLVAVWTSPEGPETPIATPADRPAETTPLPAPQPDPIDPIDLPQAAGETTAASAEAEADPPATMRTSTMRRRRPRMTTSPIEARMRPDAPMTEAMGRVGTWGWEQN